MEPERFQVRSSRGDIDLACYRIVPEDAPKGTFLMVHGMMEHILRYKCLAEHLMDNGYAVYGFDQLGHGNTSPDDLGFVAEKDGDVCFVEDVRKVSERIESDYPDVPHFVFGHSMGSLVVRRYIAEYGDTVDGAILMGSGHVRPVKFATALAMLKVMKVKSLRSHSDFMDKQVFYNYNRTFHGDNPYRWLSTDADAVQAYADDPKCGFSFTVSAYHDLMMLLKRLYNEENFDRIPKDLPIMFMSGAEDPFGEFGKGISEIQGILGKYGVESEAIIYDGARHSLVDERCKDEVFSDIVGWLDSSI